jgi:hypothetical protein
MLDHNDYQNQQRAQEMVMRLLEVSDEVLTTFDLFKSLKEVRDLSPAIPENVIAFCLLSRQRECFEGNRAVSREGRAIAAQALVRMQYETYLHSLFMMFGEAVGMKGEQLAIQFLGVAGRAQMKALKSNRQELVRVGKEKGFSARECEEMILDAMRQPREWADKLPPALQRWHGFQKTEELYQALWPQGSEPVFPDRAFNGKRRKWDDLFQEAWCAGSGHVHGDPSSVIMTAGKGTDGWIADGPVFNPIPLSNGIILFALSGQAVAEKYGLAEEWELIVSGTVERFEAITGEMRTQAYSTGRKQAAGIQ